MNEQLADRLGSVEVRLRRIADDGQAAVLDAIAAIKARTQKTTPARDAVEYARRMAAKAEAEGVGAFDRMILAMQHGFSFIARRIESKAELRVRINGDWSNDQARIRFGWFFRDVQKSGLSIDQTLTVLDHYDRTRDQPHRPCLDKRSTLTMRMLLRWLRLRHPNEWHYVVAAMADTPTPSLIAAE